MPEIKVLRVEVKHSEQYGNRKVLHVDDGSKWNVAEKKPFYNSVTGPGLYEAEFKDYQGKPYIAYIRFKGALDAQNQATSPVKAAGNGSVAGAGYEANLKARLEADKKRQDDIRLEFYCGIAKDILIANSEKGMVINPNDVLAIGCDLYKKHLEALELLQAQTAPAPSSTGTAYERATAELRKTELSEDEIPE
jgi:hypothetical protein